MNSHGERGMKVLCLAFLTIAGAFALVEAGWFFRDSRLDLRDARVNLESQSLIVHQILQTSAASAEQLRQAATQANLAAQDERSYFQKTSLEAYKTAAAARLVLVRTDHSLNDVLAPQLEDNLKDSDLLLRQATSDIHSTVISLQPTLESLAQASSAAAAEMADPHIADAVANVDSISKAIALASLNVANTTQSLDAMATMLKKRLEQLLKPVSLAERFAERIIGLGTSTYGVVK